MRIPTIKMISSYILFLYLIFKSTQGYLEMNGDSFVDRGGVIKLECEMFNNNVSGIRWFRRHSYTFEELTRNRTNVRIKEKVHRRTGNIWSELKISNTQMVDSGLYICSNRNLTEQDSKTVVLLSVTG